MNVGPSFTRFLRTHTARIDNFADLASGVISLFSYPHFCSTHHLLNKNFTTNPHISSVRCRRQQWKRQANLEENLLRVIQIDIKQVQLQMVDTGICRRGPFRNWMNRIRITIQAEGTLNYWTSTVPLHIRFAPHAANEYHFLLVIQRVIIYDTAPSCLWFAASQSNMFTKVRKMLEPSLDHLPGMQISSSILTNAVHLRRTRFQLHSWPLVPWTRPPFPELPWLTQNLVTHLTKSIKKSGVNRTYQGHPCELYQLPSTQQGDPESPWAYQHTH